MRRVWVGVLGGLLIAGQVAAKDTPAKTRIPIVEVPSQPAEGAAIQSADSVHVRVGSGNVLTFPSRVLRVAVGDEKIVAVHVVESRQILLQGLIAGRSTVFVWLEDGRRLRYDLVVSPRVEVLENALHDLDPRIVVDAGPDGSTLLLSGKVDDEHVANEARQLAENMLGGSTNGASRVVSLLQFPGSNDADLRLTVALAAVDPRIRLRRMQVGNKVSNTADAVVLEGRVKDIPSLVRAITLAELQLGGVGGKIEPLSNEPAQSGRNRNFSGGLSRLGGGDPPVSGLAAYVARGLILKSSSGRVLSFLEVDELPQIMVSIRVLQVDRGRAKHLGIDYRLDGTDFSAGSFHQPGRSSLPAPAVPPVKQTIAGILGGNIVGTFVTKSLAVAAAIDFLQQKDVARSVAEPNITTLSGESASVLIGGEVPIPTTTVGTTASVQGFLFQDFGVRLDIRPTLAPSGLVAMEIAPSIIRPSADLAVSGVPGFQVQSVQTTAKVAPGQTLVLGGLISFNDEIQKRGVPGLSEIPLMKHLFSWEGRTLSEQEILFVITPRILAEGPDQVEEAIQWRDVEPITAGAVVELPPADLDSTANLSAVTLGHDGMPPSFSKTGRRSHNATSPTIIEDHAPPPPPPPSVMNTPPPEIAPRYEAESRSEAARSTEQKQPAKDTRIIEPVKTNPDPAKSSVTSAEPVRESPAPQVPTSAASTQPADAPIIREPLAPAAAPAASTKPSTAESRTASNWAAGPLPVSPSPASAKAQALPAQSAPSASATKSPLVSSQPRNETTNKTSESKPAQSPAASTQSQPPAPANAVASSAASSSIAKTNPAPAAPAIRTTPLPVTPAPQPSAALQASEKPATAGSVTPPASSATIKKPESTPTPVAVPAVRPSTTSTTSSAPQPAIAHGPEKTTSTVSRQAFSVPQSTAGVKKIEPAAAPSANAQSVRSVTSAPAPTPPPSPAIRQPNLSHPAAPVPSSSPSGSMKSEPAKQAQSKSAPAMPAPITVTPTPAREPAPAARFSSSSRGSLAAANLSDGIRAWLTKDYRIEVVVSPHEGDAWTRLAKRMTGDARHWQELARLNGADEKLTSEAHVHVPFEMLKPSIQQEITDKLLPKGSAAESDWKRMSGQH
ncbi:MAG: pilus assembly protein CpaC [Thermoanaerobaculia bacterium]|jgi:Flp pilus assembly secretin CpaC|nr:pilus assembly protein CpaC [Thermoanaerobaculia bacterium]